MSLLKKRLEVAEKYGTTPLDFLMSVVADADAPKEDRITCAVAAAPYCHAKLKQIEINDVSEPRQPSQIERDITALVERLDRAGALAAGRRGDLIGVAEGA